VCRTNRNSWRSARADIDAIDFWGLGDSSFPEVAALRREILELPCHQSLDDEDIDRVARAVKKRRCMRSLPNLEVAVHNGDPGDLHDLFSALIDPQHPAAPFRSAPGCPPGESQFHARRPHVLVVKRGTHPIALLPLYEDNHRLKLMGDGSSAPIISA